MGWSGIGRTLDEQYGMNLRRAVMLAAGEFQSNLGVGKLGNMANVNAAFIDQTRMGNEAG